MAMGILSRVVVREAINIVLPAFEALAIMRAKRQHLHVVVVDGTLKDQGMLFGDAILVEHSVGSRTEWRYPYDHIARSKAEISWRTGEPSIMAAMLAPATLRPGDTVHWGAFVLNGIIVGVSGVQPWFDMLVASWVAWACQQLLQDEIHLWRKAHPDADFLPAEPPPWHTSPLKK